MPIFKNKKALLVSLVMLTLIAAGLYWWVVSNRPVSEEDYSQFVRQVEALNGKQDYQAVEQLINEQLAKNLTQQQRYEVYLKQATNYQNQGRIKEALAALRQAEAISPTGLTFVVARNIAQLSQAQGDRQTALDYYKKAIEIAKVDDDTFNDLYIPGLEANIELLENNQDPASVPAINYSEIPEGVPPPPQ